MHLWLESNDSSIDADTAAARRKSSLFFADRTNRCSYATVLRPSAVCLSVTYVLRLNGAS